jgi:hypothetical protein
MAASGHASMTSLPAASSFWPPVRTVSVSLPTAQCRIRSVLGAQVFDAAHLGRHLAAQHHRLGPHAQPVGVAAGGHVAAGDPAPVHPQQVHRRRADEAGSEGGRGPRIEGARRRRLFDPALVQEHHLVGHAHGLGLVVRHVDDGEAQALLQLAQLGAHLLAQLRVQVGQRLVHQADLGLRHQRAAQRHPLLLAARELRRLAIEQGGQAEQFGRLGQPLRHFGGRRLAHREAEGDVVGHAQVREQRIVLEHHRDVALGR